MKNWIEKIMDKFDKKLEKESKKKKCCDSPDVLKLKEGKRECKSCGKKWKLKKKGIQDGRSK